MVLMWNGLHRQQFGFHRNLAGGQTYNCSIMSVFSESAASPRFHILLLSPSFLHWVYFLREFLFHSNGILLVGLTDHSPKLNSFVLKHSIQVCCNRFFVDDKIMFTLGFRLPLYCMSYHNFNGFIPLSSHFPLCSDMFNFIVLHVVSCREYLHTSLQREFRPS